MQHDTFSTRFDRLRSAQKRSRGVPLYTLRVNRPVGRAIAAASPPDVTPNHLTIIGAVLTYGGLLWLMFGATGPAAAVVGVALVVGFFFDSADGQLARLRGTGSLRGEWLDHVLDSGRIALMHVATLWFLLRTDAVAPLVAVLVTTAFLVSAVLVFFGGILFDQLMKNSTGLSRTPPPASARRSLLMLPLDYGLVCVLYLFTAFPPLFAVGYVVLAVIKVCASGAFLAKWYRGLAMLDRERATTSDAAAASNS